MLFVSEKDLNRHSGEVKVLPHLVLDESTIRFCDVLGKVAVIGKRRRVGWQLLNVLDLDVLTL